MMTPLIVSSKNGIIENITMLVVAGAELQAKDLVMTFLFRSAYQFDIPSHASYCFQYFCTFADFFPL